MKNIKVLGTGCTNCKTTLKLIDAAAKARGVEVELEKVEDLSEIMRYGVMSTPGVVVDGKLVHAGGIPSADVINFLFDSSSSVDSSENCGTGCCT